MCPCQRVHAGFGRFLSDQSDEFGVGENVQNVLKPRRTFWMAGRQFMLQTIGMGDQSGGHLAYSDDFEVVESLLWEFVFQCNIATMGAGDLREIQRAHMFSRFPPGWNVI